MTKPTRRRPERNIYVSQRCGSYRFRVEVSPLGEKSGTFDTEAEGWAWATQMRAELIARRHALKRSVKHGGELSNASACPPLPPPTPSATETAPATIRIGTILDHYEDVAVSALADLSEARARLRNLRLWFGERNLGELTRGRLEKWVADRLAGRLGSGRRPGRTEYGSDEPRLTKDQRRRARLKDPTAAQQSAVVYPVSSQTARHELMYLRRAVTRYFDDNGLREEHSGWLSGRPLMLMSLPAPSQPRSRRLGDADFARIIGAMKSEPAQHATLLALATGLRRSEIVSLRWEDVDIERRVVWLRSPGYASRGAESVKAGKLKTKTEARDIPLTDEALVLLSRMGTRACGPLFAMRPPTLTQAWRRAAVRAGVPDARLHDVRREALTRLVEEFDLPLQLVTVFSGHRDLATLQRHYLRPSAEKVAQRISGRRVTKDIALLEKPSEGALGE